MPLSPRLSAACAGLVAFAALLSAGSARAQFIIERGYGFGYGPPPVVIEEDEGPAPEDIPVIVRRGGYRPVGPVIEGPTTYRMEALDRAGRRVNVVVDADTGRILTVRPARGSETPPPARPRVDKPRPSAEKPAPAPQAAPAAPKMEPPAAAPVAPPKAETPRPAPAAPKADGPKADESPAPSAPAPKAESPKPVDAPKPDEAPKSEPAKPAEPPKAEDKKSESPAPEAKPSLTEIKSDAPATAPGGVRVVGPPSHYSRLPADTAAGETPKP